MKAYHLNGHAGAGGLVRDDVSKPEPANGEVRIRVEAASLNYRDLLILDAAGQPFGDSQPTFHLGQQQDAAIRRQPAAVKASDNRLAADR